MGGKLGALLKLSTVAKEGMGVEEHNVQELRKYIRPEGVRSARPIRWRLLGKLGKKKIFKRRSADFASGRYIFCSIAIICGGHLLLLRRENKKRVST